MPSVNDVSRRAALGCRPAPGEQRRHSGHEHPARSTQVRVSWGGRLYGAVSAKKPQTQTRPPGRTIGDAGDRARCGTRQWNRVHCGTHRLLPARRQRSCLGTWADGNNGELLWTFWGRWRPATGELKSSSPEICSEHESLRPPLRQQSRVLEPASASAPDTPHRGD